MKYGQKLPLMIASLLMASVITGLICVYQLNSLSDDYADTIKRTGPLSGNTAKIQRDFKTQIQEWKNVLLRGKNPERLKKYWSSFEKHEKSVQEYSQSMLHSVDSPEVKKTLAEFIQQHNTMATKYRQGFEKFKAAEFDPFAGDAAVTGVDRPAGALLKQLVTLTAEKAQNDIAAATVQRINKTWFSVAVLLAVSLVAFFLSFLIARNVIAQFGGEPDVVRTLVRKIATGDLETEIYVKQNDQTSILAAMKEMRESLVLIVSQVRKSSQSIEYESQSIAAKNKDLSGQAQQQVKALVGAAEEMQQLGTTVKENTDHAQKANKLAESASSVAIKGQSVVENVVTTMQEINESSQKIADIISVIDGIAFQTNLLALNAAVEAARAGEQGKGFAVVATEVRALAQRSAAAADEIKALITDSVSRVEQGTTFVAEAGSTMEDIVNSVQSVTEIMADINHASIKQNESVAQVSATVNEMETSTHHSSSLVSKSMSGAEALELQAEQLVSAVSVFKLGNR